MSVHMKKAGLVLGRIFWMLNSMLRVSRWCEAFQHVSVCLSVSLFNGSWVGCRAFFSPYSQHMRRWIIHVCIQKVYLRGKRFIIHSLSNQWLIVFSPQPSRAPLLSSMVHFLIADFSLCRGSEGGSEGRREGHWRREKQQQQPKVNTFKLQALMSKRILPILHLGEKMGSRPAPEWSVHAQAMSHCKRKFYHYRHTQSIRSAVSESLSHRLHCCKRHFY